MRQALGEDETVLRNSHPASRTAFLVALLLVLANAPGHAQCTSGTSVSQWQCWEQTITSSVNLYAAGGGNPYRDLVLRVTFTSATDGTSFTQDAFWLGDTTNATTAKNFKVRAALPPGSWTWQVAGCTGVTAGTDCSTVTWTPSTGPITVTASTSGPQLYARGFPTQTCFWLRTNPPRLGHCGPLVYGDQVTPFFWVGDSAWSAPAFEIDAQLHGGAQYWSQYLAIRTPDGTGPGNYHFTALLIAPADHWQKQNDPDVFFAQPSPCTLPAAQQGSYPNDCSIPKPAYWNAFDSLVAQATQQDLFLVIAGLVHPLDTNVYTKYPSLNNVTHFSRYLAARMAGFAAMFSPGFDMPVGSTAVDGSSVKQLMDASGLAVQAASPRALITNHLNGQATCDDYMSFAIETPSPPNPWMRSYLFQSGHAINRNGTGGMCPGFSSTDPTPVFAAMRRAITMPSTLASNGPGLPSINGEGPYDDTANDNPPLYAQVNMRYRLRQAANLSSLSDAQGFTYGVPQLGLWMTPPSYWALDSARLDMKSLGDRFRPYPGLPTHPDWIVNNATLPYDQQAALASDGATIAIAYLPPLNPTSPQINSITLSTSGLPGLGCPNTGSPWTLTWEGPTTNAIQQVLTCSQSSGQITVTSPPCSTQPTNAECDWILLISKTGAPAPAPTQSASAASPPVPGKLDVWRDLSMGDGTSAIRARIVGADTASNTIEVSPSGLAFQEAARVALVPGGYIVVWHADGLDGSLLGVFGQRLDAGGKLVGSMFRVNSTTVYDQRDPAIAADSAGNTVIVWSSYGQDGDLGGIYGQLFDAKGVLTGGEFQINSVTAGHQARPQVVFLPGGGFVVGWTTKAIGDNPGALSLRVFNRNGSPLTPEIRIPGSDSLHPELVDLQSEAAGSFSLRWLLRADTRATVASYLQRFTSQGAALATPVMLP